MRISRRAGEEALSITYAGCCGHDSGCVHTKSNLVAKLQSRNPGVVPAAVMALQATWLFQLDYHGWRAPVHWLLRLPDAFRYYKQIPMHVSWARKPFQEQGRGETLVSALDKKRVMWSVSCSKNETGDTYRMPLTHHCTVLELFPLESK